MNTLNEIKDSTIPFLPNLIIGINISQVKMIALIGYKDQVNPLDIAISQIEQTIMPRSNTTEKDIAIMFCIETIFLFTVFSS